MAVKKLQLWAVISVCVAVTALAVLGILVVASGRTAAAALGPATMSGVPNVINYQGMLREPDGTPINGPYTMTFKLYDDPVLAGALYTETLKNVMVREGLFTVLLGDVDPISAALFKQALYVGMQVGDDAEMAPRQRLAPVPYAVQLTDGIYVDEDGSVGVGTTSPGARLDVNGDAVVSGDATVSGMLSVTDLHVAGTTNLGPHFITPEEVDSDAGNRTVDWTTFQAGDYIDPSATAVILDATAAMDRPDSGDIDAEIWIRADPSSPGLRFIRGRSNESGDSVAWSAQGIFPVASDLSFQYNVESPGFFHGFQIRLIGYFGGSE